MSDPIQIHPNWREEFVSGILAITKRKSLVVVVCVFVSAIALANWMTTKPYYQASSTIVLLPREKPILDIAAQSDSLEASDDTARRASASSLTLPPNPDLYITLMKSGDLADRISQRLKPGYTLSATQIRKGISVESGDENGLLTVSCQTPDPKISAIVVGYVIDECQEASKAIERQLILQQTGFLDGAVIRMKSQVDLLTDRVNQAAEVFGVSDPELAASRSLARLRRLDESQIRIENQLHAYLLHRTSVDPLVKTLQAELDGIHSSRSVISKNFCGKINDQEYSKKLVEWKALHQELNQTQDMHMSLTAKRDLFKIRSEQPSGNLAIIRPPSIPSAPAGPSKRRAISIALVMGTGLSLMACVISDQVSRMKEDEKGRELINEVVASLIPRILFRKGSS